MNLPPPPVLTIEQMIRLFARYFAEQADPQKLTATEYEELVSANVGHLQRFAAFIANSRPPINIRTLDGLGELADTIAQLHAALQKARPKAEFALVIGSEEDALGCTVISSAAPQVLVRLFKEAGARVEADFAGEAMKL